MSDIPFDVNDLELAYVNPEGFNTVGKREIVGKGRWTTTMQRIISDGNRYFRLQWSEGNTEYQETNDTVYVDEVWPKQIMTTIYVTEKPE